MRQNVINEYIMVVKTKIKVQNKNKYICIAAILFLKSVCLSLRLLEKLGILG